MPSFRAVSLEDLKRCFGLLLRFAAVGAATTTLDFALFVLLVTAIPAAPANVLSYSCGIALSYVLNRSWTFGVDGNALQALKFAVATFTGLALSTLLVAALVQVLPPAAAKLVSVPVIFGWNFLTAHFWVFRPGRTQAARFSLPERPEPQRCLDRRQG